MENAASLQCTNCEKNQGNIYKVKIHNAIPINVQKNAQKLFKKLWKKLQKILGEEEWKNNLWKKLENCTKYCTE